MERLTVEQWKLINRLANNLPSHYTLKDVLNREDLNPNLVDTTVHIESVKFSISGILQYAYELTGEIREYEGTIKDIIYELVGDDIFNEYGGTDVEMVKIKDIWKRSEIEELAKFFLGNRNEKHLDEVTATSTREVTLKEIINYIKELQVVEDFKYTETVLDF